MRAAKRLFDFIGAVALVVVFSPILAAVAIAIKISMPGPVFYTQERIGLDGRPFRIIKFRSMIVDADAQLSTLLVTQGTADQPLFKVDSDPRVTRLGQILRRSSLDELPQLFNVIGGSMSLVGPRPQRDGEVALYRGSDHHRLGVRPGMTGLWQVSGRSDLGWDEAREFDLYYAHTDDEKVDQVAVAETFDALVRSGKVSYVGASNFSLARLKSAMKISEKYSLAHYRVVQDRFNLVSRAAVDAEKQEYLRSRGIAELPYHSLASGFLTGKHTGGDATG
ncbi:hypothetical protein ETC03_19245, partial [Geobacillus sp. MMMUD3]|nr:hypothetical protein [Geobacillus sp. MMMUD3]